MSDGGIDAFIEAEHYRAIADKAEHKSNKLTKQVAALKRTVKDVSEENDSLRQTLGVLDSAKVTAPSTSPAWVSRRKKASATEAIPISIWSDHHYDEVVRASEVQESNSYNRKIATLRLQTLAEKMVYASTDLVGPGFTFPGACIFMLGDMVSGEGLHHELDVTNDAPIMESVVYWADQLAAALQYVLEHFPRLHIVAVPGNHGRITKKMPFKRRVHTNYDWLLYKIVEKHFADNELVTWEIPDSISTVVTIGGWPYLVEHGCEFRGGSGIAGLYSPLMLGIHKRYLRQLEIGKPFRTLCIGHFHKYTPAGDKFIVSGSLKGPDEYSSGLALGAEPPTAAYWLSTADYGPILHLGLRCRAKGEKRHWS
jgi:hypothetical protein